MPRCRGLRPLRRLHRLHLRDRAGARRCSPRGSRSARSSSAATCSRRSSTGPTARRSCSSATAPARSCSSAVDEGGFLGFELGADGGGGANLWLPGQRLAAASTTRSKFVKMNGREVFKFATRVMVSSAEAILDECGLTIDDVDVYVPHQANVRIIDHAVKKLGVPQEKVVVNVDRYGNTSSGSIPLALADAARRRPARAGQAGADDRDGRRPHLGLGVDRLDTRDDWSAGMTKIAFMFPGQGSFEAGMGTDDRRGRARGDGRLRRGQRGVGPRPEASSASTAPVEELVDTEVQQPALVATSLAIDAALRARGIVPDYVVGHSVGEFAALGSAQLDRRSREAIALVRERGPRDGRGREGAPGLDGGDPRPRRRGGRGALQEDPRTCGRRTTTARASSSSRARRPPSTRRASRREREGARRAVRLRVSGAFHSPLVARAAERLRPAIEKVHLPRAARAFMSTVTAKLEDAQRYRELLVEQLTAPVRFTQAARELIDQGVTTFVEVGPGNVLSGLLKRIDSSVRSVLGQRPEVARRSRARRLAERRFASLEGKTRARHRRLARHRPRDRAGARARRRRRSSSATARGRTRPRSSPPRSAAARCRPTSRRPTTRRGSSRRPATSTCSSTTPA